jgi:hypothetical protein
VAEATQQAEASAPARVCGVCDGLLGPLPMGSRYHPLCAWATPEDWRVISAWFNGAGGGMGSE